LQVFGVDIGGSGIKGALVDLETGILVAKRERIPTPKPSTPEAVGEVVAELIAMAAWKGPVGVTVPGVVREGVVYSAANIDAAWVGTDAAGLFSERIGAPVTVLNDADAAGIAEVRYGAGRGQDGVVLLLTFGTGIGSALVHDGRLLPNTEFGHLQFRNTTAEQYAAARLVERKDVSLKQWTKRVGQFLAYLEEIFWLDLIIAGGGISKRFETYGPKIATRALLVPAMLRNQAGIVGAAMAAAPEGDEDG
jgi:polyphosphate glucokinase